MTSWTKRAGIVWDLGGLQHDFEHCRVFGASLYSVLGEPRAQVVRGNIRVEIARPQTL